MEGDGYLPANKIPVIADAVNAACDALDGVKDGLLNDPRRCHFDPATLLCKNGDGPNCLTGAQVESVQKIYTGLRNADGDQLYPGLMPGGEAGLGDEAGHAGLDQSVARVLVTQPLPDGALAPLADISG